MKSIARTAGLCLAATFVMSMAAAVTASANPVWEACLSNTTAKTRYESSACQKVGTTNSFAWEEVKNTDNVRILGLSIGLKDTGATGGTSLVVCGHVTIEGKEGTVGPGGLGLVTVANAPKPKEECARVEGGCKAGEVEKVAGANLPWQTEMYETEGAVQTKIAPGPSGEEPGWEVSCNTLLGKQTDRCLTKAAADQEVVTLTNKLTNSELLVLGKFLEKHKANCSQSSKEETGSVLGQLAILLESKAGLRVS